MKKSGCVINREFIRGRGSQVHLVQFSVLEQILPQNRCDSSSVTDSGPLGIGTRIGALTLPRLPHLLTNAHSLQTLLVTTTPPEARRAPSSRNAIRKNESLGPRRGGGAVPAAPTALRHSLRPQTRTRRKGQQTKRQGAAGAVHEQKAGVERSQDEGSEAGDGRVQRRRTPRGSGGGGSSRLALGVARGRGRHHEPAVAARATQEAEDREHLRSAHSPQGAP